MQRVANPVDQGAQPGDDRRCEKSGDQPARKATVHDVDPAAIRAAAAGDVAAFDAVVRAFQTPVWRYLEGLVGDPHLAEDLTQETFLRAFTKLSTYAFQARLSTWLFQVARNVAVDAMRASARRGRLVHRIAPPGDHPGPEAGSELHAALRTLPAKLREALLLVEVLGFTCAETGKILGVPEGTVKSRLFHARKRLVAWFAAGEERAGEL
jgi:RNA polymerase sigma-70 factor, ECF subfamily